MVKDNSWKKREGVVFSTFADFQYTEKEDDTPAEAVTLAPAEQKLRVSLERKGRAGKTVTLVTGFIGTTEDLKTLEKTLKTRIGTGGSSSYGEILIQGDMREKVLSTLISLGYRGSKRGN